MAVDLAQIRRMLDERGIYQHDDVRSLCDEVERLRAIVDKLPRTADGVPLFPGQVLYYRSPAGIVPTVPIENWASISEFLDEGKCSLYSTREAAEFALT